MARIAIVGEWKKFLGGDATAEEMKRSWQRERTGRPLGNAQLIRQLEEWTGRVLRKLKPGPKAAGKVGNK